MVERVHIPKKPADEDRLLPGTWYVDYDGNLWHKCPQCKQGAVMAGHAVATDGTVSPSIACFSPCTYHVWGILDNWIYGVKMPDEKVIFTEQTCPGHTASENDSKICGRCGVNINELEPPAQKENGE